MSSGNLANAWRCLYKFTLINMCGSGLRVRALPIYALVALAAVALPIEASEPIHVHHGEAPALYNGECLLAALAAFHGVAPLPSVPISVSFGLVVGAALLHAVIRVVAPLVRYTDSRAPPVV
jgi:hypothetical protein